MPSHAGYRQRSIERLETPEPGISLTIGAVGHRDLGQSKSDLAHRVLDTLEQVAASHPEASCSLICSVADGADRLFLAAAARLGIPYDCPLPCTPQCFRQDFQSVESRSEFDHMLANARTILQPTADLDKEAGYLWVSDLVLARSNALLAIWNGKPGHGPAGTSETVARAQMRGIPVVWIGDEPPYPVRTLGPTEDVATFQLSHRGESSDCFDMVGLRKQIEDGDID